MKTNTYTDTTRLPSHPPLRTRPGPRHPGFQPQRGHLPSSKLPSSSSSETSASGSRSTSSTVNRATVPWCLMGNLTIGCRSEWHESIAAASRSASRDSCLLLFLRAPFRESAKAKANDYAIESKSSCEQGHVMLLRVRNAVRTSSMIEGSIWRPFPGKRSTYLIYCSLHLKESQKCDLIEL
ncbi:hypothetical protein FIBSPDRAFT_428665 [Athelia psychrophila]|uniref:Uncharacterized protein n=1 Tax=Athelia psychrophila TaxID=1759441 RepID=A0A167UKJ1_9AGAM|nr:hypothetical protein FIBSPDRAFT_428665 [Fibularhizoctonia sp. CBS 109695]